MASLTAKEWKAEIDRADKRDTDWVKRGDKIVARYRDDRRNAMTEARTTRRMNIFWSNVQTLLPALYARRPKPIVERRFLDHDPVGRVAATLLERSISYEIEDNGYHEAIGDAVLDYLLVGRGQVWARYEPKFGEAVSPEQEGGSPYDEEENAGGDGTGSVVADGYGRGSGEGAGSIPGSGQSGVGDADEQRQLVGERVCIDYVQWKDFLTSQARTWAEVTWVARRVYMGRGELIERFGETKGKAIPLEKQRDANGRFMSSGEGAEVTKGTVYEIWCKETGKVHFIAQGYDEFCDEVDDPLHLEGFWPCPMPLYATRTHETLIPVPDFAEYQDQADEIDLLTNRIASLSRALKVAGVYDASAPGLARILDEGMENKLVPVSNWAAFAEKGGIDGAISWLPIKDIAAVLIQLQEARTVLKADLYEITGIADIIRGQSDPRETLGAQQIKGSFATQRLQMRQSEVSRFARDAIRIIGEIMAEQFSPETLIETSSIMQDDGLVKTSQPAMSPGPGGPSGPPIQPPALPPPVPASGGPAMLPGPGGPMAGSAPPMNGGMPPLPAALGPISAPPMGMPGGIDPVMIQKMQMVAQAIALLRDQKMRGFRIEIETDSTIQADAISDKQSATELVQALAQMMTQAIQAAEVFPASIPLTAAIIQFAVRKFRTGRDLEAKIDEFIETAEQMAASQSGQANGAQAAAQAKAAVDQQKAASDAALAQAKNQAEMQRMTMQAQIDAAAAEQQKQLKIIEAQIKIAEAQARERQMQREEEIAAADHARRVAETILGAEVAREQASAKKAAARQTQ